MLIVLIYELVLWVIALIATPKFLYALIVHKKYRSSFGQRLSRGFPRIEKNGKKLVWIHAVSVGEVKAIAELVKMLKAQAEKPLILISTITETGHAEAKRSIPFADYYVFLPFDFYWLAKRALRLAKPDLVLVCETDFWFNFLRIAKGLGCPIALVNGKISERSVRRFKKFSFFTKRLVALFDVFCLQSPHYADRFLAIGVPESKITVTGNLKFDSPPEAMSLSEKADFMGELGIAEGDKVIVIGSSHDPEERLLLGSLGPLLISRPELKLIIAPRHPERFAAVEACLKNSPWGYRKFSDRHSARHSASGQIILLDAMGLLTKCYQIASVAIVAGSYTPKIGGHNILEPMWYEVPVVYGPFMHSQPEIAEVVERYSAALKLPLDQTLGAVEELLEDGSLNKSVKQASNHLVQDMRGSTQRTLEALEHLTALGPRRNR